MLCSVLHRTLYRYTEPVQLCGHRVRLRPRADGRLRELEYALRISPEPMERTEYRDDHGNAVAQLAFAGETRELVFESAFRVDTLPAREEHVAIHTALGAPYSPDERQRLDPYLHPDAVTSQLAALADELAAAAEGDVAGFLSALNGWIHRSLKHEIRESGHPHTPAETLARGRGACRDLTVLFIELCRSRGLAARFVSGYRMKRVNRPQRHMHAWPEVYLPGIGWRGYDPSHGEAVAEAHVAVAAAAAPGGAAPIEGAYYGGAASTLTVDLRIRVEP